MISDDGMILDGRNRHHACVEAGVQPNFRDYQGDDPAGFVASANLHRRHLSTSQRALIASKLADSKHGGDRTNPQKYGLTYAQAAERLKISRRSVDSASALRKAVEAGALPTDLLDRVSAGKVKLSSAMRELKAVRMKRAPVRAKWSRVADELVVQVASLCRRMDEFVADIEEAGTPNNEMITRLVQSCDEAAVRFHEQSERLKHSYRPGMQFKEA